MLNVRFTRRWLWFTRPRNCTQLYMFLENLLKASDHVLCRQSTAQHGYYRSKMKLKVHSLEPNGSLRCCFADSYLDYRTSRESGSR